MKQAAGLLTSLLPDGLPIRVADSGAKYRAVCEGVTAAETVPELHRIPF
jgi:hypothetical protein